MADALSLDIEKRYPGGATIRAAWTAPMPPGGILVLFGPSGSGKTTVLRSLGGLERPDRGVIRFGDETWFDAQRGHFVEPQARRIGYVFQEAALFPHLTVRENVEYGVSPLDAAGHQVGVGDMMDLFELGDLARSYPRQLSGGQAQRVALARAMAFRPRLLLLDEPFASLDMPARARLRTLLRAAIRRLGTSAVLVTHDRHEAIALGDQMVVLADGCVRQVGPVLDVFRHPADLVVARAAGVDSVLPAQVVGSDNGLLDLRVGDRVIRAVDSGAQGSALDVFACIRAEDVALERAAVTAASARNHLPGRIVSIGAEGPLERVMVDCGFPLSALITRNACEEMALEAGDAVVAAIKATAIHLVSRA